MRRSDGWDYQAVLGLLACLVLLFALTDCSAGATTAQTSTILDKYVDRDRTCDEDGRCSTNIDYMVVVDCGSSAHRFSTTWWTWSHLRHGQRVHLAHRDGRWTGVHYMHWINKRAESEW